MWRREGWLENGSWPFAGQLGGDPAGDLAVGAVVGNQPVRPDQAVWIYFQPLY